MIAKDAQQTIDWVPHFLCLSAVLSLAAGFALLTRIYLDQQILRHSHLPQFEWVSAIRAGDW